MLEREIDGGEQGREVRDGRRKGRNGGARKREEGRDEVKEEEEDTKGGARKRAERMRAYLRIGCVALRQ